MASSETHLELPRPTFADPVKLLIVVSPYYKDIADQLVMGAKAEIEAAGGTWELAQVPGALEIPTAIAIAHGQANFDGYVALGCVIQMTISSLVWLHYYVLLLPMLLVALRPWSDNSRRGWGSVVLHRVVPLFAFVLLLDSPLIGFFDVTMMEWLQTTTTIVIVSLLSLGLWQLAFPDPVIRRKEEDSG